MTVPRRATGPAVRAAALVLSAAVAGGVAGCAGTPPPTPSDASAATSSGTGGEGAAEDPQLAAVDGRRIDLEVTGGRVRGASGRVAVPSGEYVTVTVTSDVADEIHLHGYDLSARVAPGSPATLTFDATLPGVFELELHEAGTVLVTLQIG